MNGSLIIETRNIADLNKIIRDHITMLPYKWKRIVMCSQENYADLSRGNEDLNITYQFLSKQPFTAQKYNLMLTNPEFWESLEMDYVLIYQADSMLMCRGVEEFIAYDYTGSPWSFQDHGGNGGLSLRKVETMKMITEKYPYDPFLNGNEDVYFCNIMHQQGMNLAPREVCEEFSCEAIFELGTVGYHAIEKWLTKEECEQIKNQYK